MEQTPRRYSNPPIGFAPNPSRVPRIDNSYIICYLPCAKSVGISIRRAKMLFPLFLVCMSLKKHGVTFVGTRENPGNPKKTQVNPNRTQAAPTISAHANCRDGRRRSALSILLAEVLAV